HCRLVREARCLDQMQRRTCRQPLRLARLAIGYMALRPRFQQRANHRPAQRAGAAGHHHMTIAEIHRLPSSHVRRMPCGTHSRCSPSTPQSRIEFETISTFPISPASSFLNEYRTLRPIYRRRAVFLTAAELKRYFCESDAASLSPAKKSKPAWEGNMSTGRRLSTALLLPLFAAAAGIAALGLAPAARADEPIVIGFVTHAQGDPFVQQIIDGAEAAAHDLGVTLKVAQQSGGAPEGQL